MIKIKIFIKFILLFCLISLNNSTKAADYPKSYYKGKFYESIKNNFLVATDKLTGTRFGKSVIIIMENDKNGAWGLVINKPIGQTQINKLVDIPKKIIDKNEQLLKKKIPIFWGGPVEKNRIFILHSKDYMGENTIKYKNISISSDYKTLLKIADNKGPKNKIIILGVSSWGPGQLEGEMERDKWILSEITNELIFEIENSKKWKKAKDRGFLKL
tara:strand:+ start:1581 stop:2225 length:645 start_codon:yes stop_codon:yes gene_type:complete